MPESLDTGGVGGDVPEAGPAGHSNSRCDMIRTKPMMAALLLAAGAAACGGGQVDPGPASSPGSPGPALTVERFLQAVNANDLNTMMQLFGTADQTILERDGQSRAERHMHVLATLLHHDDYAILSQSGAPGRMRNAAELQVELRRDGRSVVVPHLVVRKESGGWIIEKIDIEKLTQSG